jgi:hypothetical protein
MRVSELPMDLGFLGWVELRPHGSDWFPMDVVPGDAVQLLESPELGYYIRLNDGVASVRSHDSRAQKSLEDILSRDLPRRCWVTQIDAAPSAPQGRSRAVRLQVHQFIDVLPLDEPLIINIDDECLQRVRELLKTSDFADTARALSREFIVDGAANEAPSILISAGRDVSTAGQSAFRIHGRRLNLDVARRRLLVNGTSVEALFATRIPARKHRQTPPPCRLAQGLIEWRDAASGSISAAVRTRLDAIVHGADSYLALWQQYNEIERQALETAATEFGEVRFHACHEDQFGCFVFECGPLAAPRLDAFDRCREERKSLEVTRGDDDELVARSQEPPFVGDVIEARSSGRVTIRPRSLDVSDPPPTGLLRVSVFGDTKRLDRRERARDMIASSRCPMPWLGMLLEGRGFPTQPRPRKQPLSPASKRAFRGPPTPAQELALDVALNTPDIAIIQGPPGTGKTRVIAALQVRLAELGEGDQGPFGQTLLTSFQHDAVDNVAAASFAFGLPAFRVGAKAGADQSHPSNYWRASQISRLKASTANCRSTPVHVARRNVRLKLVASKDAPSTLASELNLLREVRDEAEAWVDPQLCSELEALIARLSVPVMAAALPAERELALRAVRGLPTTIESALDEGPKRAQKALLALESLGEFHIADLERALLESIASWSAEGEVPGASMLPDLKAALLERLSLPTERATTPLHNEDIECMLLKVRNALDLAVQSLPFDASVAVEELIEDLESDPDAVNDELAHYSCSLAATVQHAVAGPMSDIKFPDGEAEQGEWPRFRSVIVDEAARCNPLDLMIPLSIAERRIVLVGDHRQLPHVLEPGVERELTQSASDETKAALGKSLFERLVEHARNLESVDGIKRYVRLDQQYRMPPSLGDFLCASFYEPYGERFESGRKEAELQHGLGGRMAGVRGAWIDVPTSAGTERGGRSKARREEAVRIAEQVESLLGDRPDLSVGIITFYAAQVQAIYEALEQRGIVDQVQSGRWEITSNWRTTAATGERETRDRLRVGTVDAFQGMEFDVVLLSLVRSNHLPMSDHRSLLRKFGFLLLENRVCVAMSRQERLLVVVGDSSMFVSDSLAEQPGVRQLRNFYLEFCGGPHGVRL